MTALSTLPPFEPELVRLCRDKTWVSVAARTQTHPREAMPTDSAARGEGSTALAVAVRSRAPIHVIHYLLNANFHQIGVAHIVRGNVLHEALKHRADDAVLNCLVQAAIEYDRTMVIDKTACLLGHSDELGRTALHYMVDRIVRSLDRGERSQASWNILRILVQAYPPSVSMIDADGTTPLVLLLLIPKFTAASGGLELENEVFRMAQLMVDLCPNAVKVSRRLPRPWHHHFKIDGQSSLVHGDGVPSPLSCALLHGRSIKTIDLLLNANRRIGVKGCRTIITHYREVPLHIAVTMRCSIDLLSQLIQEDREVIGLTDTHGLAPLDWMWIRHTLDWCSSSDPFAPVNVPRRRYMNNHFLDWHKRVSNQYLGIDKSMEDSPNPMVRELTRRLKDDLLKRMSVTLPAMAAQCIEDELDSMVECDIDPLPLAHAAAYVNCPLAMVQLACDSFPDLLRSKDSQLGRLPLHYACSRGGYKAQYPVGVSCNIQNMEEVPPLQTVLAKFPEASRVADSLQKLPLHIAIDYAKEAKQQHDTFEERNCQRLYYKEIELLLQSYPESLQRRDGITKLYPFLQAAEGCDSDLDMTFTLLRRDPTLVRSAIEKEQTARKWPNWKCEGHLTSNDELIR
jgi:hypothetical protein